MGCFDVYCAICGCSLVRGGDVGSTSPADLERRRRRVTQKRVELERGKPVNPGPDITVPIGEEAWHLENEAHSYDPTLVTRESLEWLTTSCCLGINPQAQGGPKAFISGGVEYYSCRAAVVQAGSDPNEPPGIEHKGLSCYSLTDPAAFPFHPCCLSILADVVTGSTDVTKIDKDALYNAMSELDHPYEACLRINYGNINNGDQTWGSIPGEEFAATNPGTTPEITDLLANCLADERFQMRQDGLGITRKVHVQDPFAALPPEIQRNIFRFLSRDSLLALLKASWAAFCTTHHNSFWKWFLKHDMPWMTELRLLLDNPRLAPEPNYKALYMWLIQVTTPRFGMDGPFMGLANRRRIWSVCEELAPRYFRQLHVLPRQSPDDTMLQGATCRHLVFVSDVKEPQGESWDLQRTFFAYSQDEIDNKLFCLSAYWTENDSLAGLCVIVDRQKRSFGLTDDDMPHLTKTAMCLARGDYVTTIILLAATTDPNRAITASPVVVGMKVYTKRQARFLLSLSLLGDLNPELHFHTHSRINLTVSDGTCLVGITGYIDPHGTIRSIGLLEAPVPPSDAAPWPPRIPPNPTAQQAYPLPCSTHPLWAPGSFPDKIEFTYCGEGRPEPNNNNSTTNKNSNNNNKKSTTNILPLTTPETTARLSVIPTHLIPHETLHFPPDGLSGIKMARLTLYLGPGSAVGRDRQEAAAAVSVPVVHGFKVEHVPPGQPKRYAGLRRNVEEWGDAPVWDDERVVVLEVDRPGGRGWRRWGCGWTLVLRR
ncbi:hypothetical protein B0I37DRAFT_407388 [Chaetomium sp. MPI-CAGE-AT-0009]|nr:hypothetical protein B0I37DRAFT_407388 [Chaetomium sp. MPI-CAGE-AT-0009]